MNDVSAIILSSGEPYVPRARRSLDAQTCQLQQVHMVENVSPFHRAFAEGASRVTTPFFVQVDADMVLDQSCVAELRAAMEDDVGIVCGDLRDPMMGQVEGIKLFRTEVARRIRQPNTVSSETDFIREMERGGWRLKYIGRSGHNSVEPQTFGEHRPDYTAAYTFQKHLLEGRKYRYRGARAGLFWKLSLMGRRQHEMMPLARIALAHGFFQEDERDQHVPTRSDGRAEALARLLASDREAPEILLQNFPLTRYASLREVFRGFHSAGVSLAAAGSGRTIHEAFERITTAPLGWPALVASLAFGHGVLSHGRATELDRDEAKLRSFVLLGVGRALTVTEWLRANLERLYYNLPKMLVPKRVLPWWRTIPRW